MYCTCNLVSVAYSFGRGYCSHYYLSVTYLLLHVCDSGNCVIRCHLRLELILACIGVPYFCLTLLATLTPNCPSKCIMTIIMMMMMMMIEIPITVPILPFRFVNKHAK